MAEPSAIPLAKQIVRSLDLPAAQAVARAALDLDSAEEVQALVRERLPEVARPAG